MPSRSLFTAVWRNDSCQVEVDSGLRLLLSKSARAIVFTASAFGQPASDSSAGGVTVDELSRLSSVKE